MVSLLAIAFQLPLHSFCATEVKSFLLINAKNQQICSSLLFFSFSKLNLALVSSAKMIALQLSVFYSARELVLAQYEKGMLCSGMDALRKQESISCTSSFSSVVRCPNAGDGVATL